MKNTEIFSSKSGIQYRVIFSRRRTIGLSISHDKGVIIRAPFRTPSQTIEEIIIGKEDWIRKHQVRFQGLKEKNNPLTYTDGSKHLFKGRNHTLKLYKTGKYFVRKNEDQIEIGVANPDNEAIVKKMLYSWYREESQKFFTEKMGDVLLKCQKYNFRPSSLVIRTMKRRWGSCSVKGKITLSTELIKMPEPCIEYVIIHELCHLRHHNHGREYYTLMAEIAPDYKINRRILKDHLM